MRLTLFVVLSACALGQVALAASNKATVASESVESVVPVVPVVPVVKYKAGKDLNFEQLVIEGQLKRPEMSVVTGDSDENGNGLLRLRENFVDRMAEAAGEDAP